MDVTPLIEALGMIMNVSDSIRLEGNTRLSKFSEISSYPQALLAVSSNQSIDQSIRVASVCALKDLVTEDKTRLNLEQNALKYQEAMNYLIPSIAINWKIGPIWY